MPESPPLAPLGVKEQQLCSEIHLAAHSERETHFSHLYLRSHSFHHYIKLVNTCESWNAHRLVYEELCVQV